MRAWCRKKTDRVILRWWGMIGWHISRERRSHWCTHSKTTTWATRIKMSWRSEQLRFRVDYIASFSLSLLFLLMMIDLPGYSDMHRVPLSSFLEKINYQFFSRKLEWLKNPYKKVQKINLTLGANDVRWLGGTKGVVGGPIPGCMRPALKLE